MIARNLQIFAILALYFHCPCQPATKFTGNICKCTAYTRDTFIALIKSGASTVLPDPSPSSNNKLISTLYLGRCTTSLTGSTEATLDHGNNPTVDKAHASIYLTWKVQCGRIFLFRGSIKWFLAASISDAGGNDWYAIFQAP